MNSAQAIKQLKYLDKITPKIRLAAEWTKPWQVLISTILSAQTRDTKTIEVSNNLYKKYPSLERLAKASLTDLKKILKSINYYKTKSKHISKTSKIILKRGIPKTIENLLELPGVGRKVANVYLDVAHNQQAIGVDTHVARISKKLNWTKEKNPYKIEEDLKKLFPKNKWKLINYTLVRFGQTYGKLKNKEDEIIKNLIKI